MERILDEMESKLEKLDEAEPRLENTARGNSNRKEVLVGSYSRRRRGEVSFADVYECLNRVGSAINACPGLYRGVKYALKRHG